jgi:hypothetical protein
VAAKGTLSGEKRIPDFIIQDGKKWFGGLHIVFMEMRAVTGFPRILAWIEEYCSLM